MPGMHTTPAATLNATFFLMTDQRGTDRTAQPTWAQAQVSSSAPGQRIAWVRQRAEPRSRT